MLVAIPAVDWVWTQAMAALLNLRLPPGSEIAFTQGGATLLSKRTVIAEQFLQHEQYAALLMLDSDMVVPPDTLERLLVHQLPLVGAVYFNRVPPHDAVASDWPDGERRLSDFSGPPVRRVFATGTGCLLVTREALQAIPRPWFDWTEPGNGEDLHFCRQAAQAGVPVYVDTSLSVGHVGATSIDLPYLQGWRRGLR